ncbi:DUF4835 family protein [Tamlana sp. s12]|uniref:type IX secretion system protein PorD n=1 Tax=Tamlana sp. s12 TaxID=1630406 RepID=UPI0008017CC2|nr:DUF4835 family protein [Tamlana sp. s12]OBQ56539.1 hypothetical protein VQ01_04100 [Tamlana sp. s12]QQY81828.1 DUF4835 family protein [Tamlana sp. s12]
MRSIVVLLLIFIGFKGVSQELNCKVVVNAQLTGNENFPIFNTLEKELTEFVNNRKWSNKTFKSQERINCSMVINVTNYSGESFQGTIQVQSSRPIYGSSYSTPVYNFNDKDFNFNYLEFQNLIYNESQYESNLISVLSFHVYMILALDADTFSHHGGEAYYEQAQVITNYSHQGNYKGWKVEDGLQSRFALIDNILSPTFKEYRSVLYDYHRKGLDVMHQDVKEGKEAIAASLMEFDAMNKRRPNSFLLRVFFDAKSDEIEDIFTEGPNVNVAKVKELLQKVAPMYSSKWQNIKY